MKKCKHPGCSREGTLSCICDYSFRSCDKHYDENHHDYKADSSHLLIVAAKFVKDFTEKGCRTIQKLKIAQHSILSKARQMMQRLQTEVDCFVALIQSRIQEIDDILAYENFTAENNQKLEGVVEIKGCEIGSFNQIIKNYFRLIIDNKEINSPTLDILTFMQENKRISSEIKAMPVTSQKSPIKLSDSPNPVQNLPENNELMLEGHTGSVYCIAITSDSQYIVSGSSDSTIRIWDLESKTEQGCLEGHTGSIRSILITADNKYIVSGSYDKTIRIWSLHSRGLQGVLQSDNSYITSVSITNDNKYVVSASSDSNLIVWNLLTRTQETVLQGHTGCVYCVAITHDNKFVVSGSYDRVLRIWNLHTRTQEAMLKGHKSYITCVAVMRNNKYCVSGSSDNTLRAWNLYTKKEEAVLQGHTDSVRTVVITNDDQYAISGSYDHTIRTWDLKNKVQEAVFQGHVDVVWGLAVANHNQFVVSVSEDKTIRMWKLNIKKSQKPVLNNFALEAEGNVYQGKYMNSVIKDKNLKTWDYKKYKNRDL